MSNPPEWSAAGAPRETALHAPPPPPPSGGLAGRELLVLGGGFGGLSAACYLARAGARVTLWEKNEQLGGRASRLAEDGFVFDMGPSWYLMPDVFERFFGHFGRRPEDFYASRQLDPHYRIFFKDGDRVDITPDLATTRALFESYERGAGAALDRYLAKSRHDYERGMAYFVYTDRPRLRDYVDATVLRQARGLSLFGSMERHVAGYFRHPKLRQIMQYTLVFLGGSPRGTPALYNLMSHVDFNLGVHYPMGGIGSLVDALASLAEALGVQVHTDTEAHAIAPREGRIAARSGDAWRPADALVCNTDYVHAEQVLLDERHRQYDRRYWERRQYAPSAFLLYLGVRGGLEPLAHHNLVLPTDWDPHFHALFESPAWPEDPAYYVCAPSQTDPDVAPPGHGNLFVLVPVAAGLIDTPGLRQAYRDQILADLAANSGLDLRQRIVFERCFAVADFAHRYHAARGTALGLTHSLRQTGFLRPRRRSSRLPGLYFTGAYTTPGIGMPMNLISGEHTAAAVIQDLAR